ncbi:hypothetical protein H4Q26_001152 [Puccinia striiformis f. sp. tritici PST-130]|nr:hypothetical protein H4Q26_001152 [Puccinia striiformis f. sp. tritici PST-130]
MFEVFAPPRGDLLCSWARFSRSLWVLSCQPFHCSTGSVSNTRRSPPNKPERPTEDTGIISALQCFFRTVLLINATPSHRFLNSTLRPTCAIIDRDLPADNCRDRFVFSCYLAPVLRLFRCMRSFECSVITESLISRLVTTARSFAIFHNCSRFVTTARLTDYRRKLKLFNIADSFSKRSLNLFAIMNPSVYLYTVVISLDVSLSFYFMQDF